MTGLDLRPHEEPDRPGDVAAGPRRGPGRSVEPVLERGAQQLVVGGMELDLVDAVAEAVVRAQHRRVDVRQPPPLDRLLAARQAPEVGQAVEGPRRALASRRVDQRRIGGEDVVARERWRLVEDLVGGRRAHAPSLPAWTR